MSVAGCHRRRSKIQFSVTIHFDLPASIEAALTGHGRAAAIALKDAALVEDDLLSAHKLQSQVERLRKLAGQ